jgi:hypothetical protein
MSFWDVWLQLFLLTFYVSVFGYPGMSYSYRPFFYKALAAFYKARVGFPESNPLSLLYINNKISTKHGIASHFLSL